MATSRILAPGPLDYLCLLRFDEALRNLSPEEFALLLARGLNARIPQAVPALLAGCPEGGVVDAHAIQPFYAGLLARSCGVAVTIEAEGEAIVVAAR